MSRAYYAAYILARNHLRDADGVRVPHGYNPHQFVATQYANDPDPRRKQIGDAMARLRTARNRCGYDDVVVNIPGLTTMALARAARIIAALAQL